MGINEVKKEILDNAKTQANALMKEADKERAEMLKASESKLEEIKKRLENEADKAVEQYKLVSLAEANSFVKKRRLAIEKEIANDVFSEAKSLLEKLPSKNRETHLNGIMKASSKFDSNKVYCAKKDISFMKKFNAIEADITGGLILEDKNGEVRVDYSYETLLESLRQKMLPEITKTLFG